MAMIPTELCMSGIPMIGNYSTRELICVCFSITCRVLHVLRVIVSISRSVVYVGVIIHFVIWTCSWCNDAVYLECISYMESSQY